MQAGKLDRRLTLERATVTYDSFNSPVYTWATLATVWGEKKEISDGERLSAQEKGADITTRFQIRYSTTVADLNPKDRLTYDSRTYDIVGVKELGRRDGLEITTKARTD